MMWNIVINTSVYPDTTSYFTSTGKALSSSMLKCTNYEQTKQVTSAEVETLSALHEFCMSDPENNAQFTHNKG